MAATEDPLPAFEFVGTPLDFSDSELLKLEAMLDAREELERMSSALKVYEEETPSLSSSEPEEEKEEDRSVAVGRASPESESSAGARIQQHDSQTSIIINNNNTKKEEDVYYREFVRIIRVAAEVIVILIVTISVLNGAFTSPPSEVFARQQLGQDAPMRAFPTGLQISCPPVQSSCYVFEILDLHDLTTVNSRAEEENGEINEPNLMEREMQQPDAAAQQWQNANSQQIIDQPQGSEPSMFRVILSTASGQVHHIAFAFVNIPLVHGCALRRLR